jgi:hypothetical protein
MAAKVLGLDLASKKSRKLSDYPYMEDYRARWSVTQAVKIQAQYRTYTESWLAGTTMTCTTTSTIPSMAS